MKNGSIIITFLVTIAILIGAIIARPNNYEYSETTTQIVRHGDTLWDIARQHSDNRHDVRRVVWEIQELSGIRGGLIHPGDELTIPVFYVLQNCN